jgi:hypothetical protein
MQTHLQPLTGLLATRSFQANPQLQGQSQSQVGSPDVEWFDVNPVPAS